MTSNEYEYARQMALKHYTQPPAPSTSRMLLDCLGGVFAGGPVILRRQKGFAWLPTTVIVNASLRTKRIWLRSYYIDDTRRRHDRLIAHRA